MILHDLIAPEDREFVLDCYRRRQAGEAISPQDEFHLLHKDGVSRVLVEVRTSLTWHQGRMATLGTLRDITERKRTEEQLREEAEINAALARVAQEMIASLDTATVLERLCRVTTEVLGCDCGHTLLWIPEEKAYRNVAGYGDTPEQWETLRAMKIPQESAVALASQMVKGDGVVEVEAATGEPGLLLAMLMRQCGLTASLVVPLRRGELVIGALTASYRGRRGFSNRQKRLARGLAQITSLALANARLLEEIERSNRVKEDFVSTMSHELRTPLNIMLGYNQLIREETFGPLTAKQADVIDRLQKTASELLELVNTTLDLSRLQSRRVPLEIQAVRIPEFMRELEVEAHQLNRKPQLQLRWEIPPDLPILHTDPVKVKMVLKNLLTNALKFTDAGTVSVQVEAQEHGVAFLVVDTGPGIAPEELAVIFEPFRQGGEFATRPEGGVGLGLYIVRQLLEVLGGEISVTSEVGKGSTFRVWLPGEGARNAGS
jgi:signal transduction histidine kinase